MKFKIRPKQDMRYELAATIHCCGLKKWDLVKKYNVDHFKDLPKEIQERNMLDYLFYENASFYLRILNNIIECDPNTDIKELQKYIKVLIDTTKPDYVVDPKLFMVPPTPPSKKLKK